MWVLETVAVAFGMYSALPAPHVEWSEKNMRYALAAFPLVGAAQGGAWWGICVLGEAFSIPAVLRGALLCASGALVTGGIHLDGYADVADALASHASPERKRDILRDPHCGAFAVIRLCVYFIACFALCCAVEPSPAALGCMGAGFVLSRALSGLALTVMPIAGGSSLAKVFADAAAKRQVRSLLGLLCCLLCALVLWWGGAAGAAMLCAVLLVLARYHLTACRVFGGTSGDLAGWFLVKAEFWMLAALVAAQLGEKVL